MCRNALDLPHWLCSLALCCCPASLKIPAEKYTTLLPCPALPPTHSPTLQLVTYEVTKLSPTEFEQRVVGHNISGLAGHRKPSWNRCGGGVRE